MKAILLLIFALLIASGVGRCLINRMGGLPLRPLESFTYASSLGLGIAAYGVFILGMFGWLSFWPVTLWWLLLGIVGMSGTVANVRYAVSAMRHRTYMRRSISLTSVPAFSLFAFVILVVFIGIALLACFKPPGANEWDVLSYHLADPKIFLDDHRITSLRTEHHSNFPFTMEMLFTVGLLYDGYTLANLFHLLMAVLTVSAILGFCRKLITPLAGWCAAVIYISTPLILWEAGVAYIDLGLALYVTLAVFAAIQAVLPCQMKPTEMRQSVHLMEVSRPWLVLAGTTMGFALGIKYLALLPFGVLGIWLLVRLRSLRLAGTYAVVAVLIASPWYVKNLVITHNPVYPYFYRLFPESRDWSADRARNYESEQSQFGYPHSLSAPLDTLQGLLTSPWHLLVHSERYSNGGEYTFVTLIGGLYAAFNFPSCLRRRSSWLPSQLLWIGLAQLLAWFFLAQIARYIIVFLPLFAVTGACAVSSLCGQDALDEGTPRKKRLVGGVALLAIVGQALLTLWAVFTLPTTKTKEALEQGVMPSALSVPEVLSILSRPDGREHYLMTYQQTYPAITWLNHNTPKDAGVILYDDTEGFYLDRPYLWGNAEHSSYIPYDQFKNGQDLTDWMLQHNYRYALINMNHNRHVGADPKQMDPMLPYGPNKNEALALKRWYEDAKQPEDPNWRILVGDALRRGLWVGEPIFQRGVVVLRIGSDVQDATHRGTLK